MENPIFIYVTYIDTTPEKVWQALTTAEFTRQYWGGLQIQSEWTVGAPVQFIKPGGILDPKGQVLQCDPPRLLSYTFACSFPGPDPVEEKTRITFEIAPAFGVTKLTVTHDHFEPESKVFNEVSNGWQAVISNLKTLLETGKPLPLKWQGNKQPNQ